MSTRLKCLSFSLFLGATTFHFPAYSMDTEVLDVSRAKSYGALKMQEHPEHKLAITNEYLEEQYKLIEGKDLAIWGVGLFAGDEPISMGIRWITDSAWSHVSLIYIDQNMVKYNLESTGSGPDILKRGILPQVQIHPWDDSVKNYSGKVAYRQITFTEKKDVNPTETTKLVKDYLGKPYETGVGVLIKSIDRNNTKETPESLFCSEMVAEIMIKSGYLSHERLADNYLPKDFSSKEFIPLQGIKLETEILVKGLEKQRGCCILF